MYRPVLPEEKARTKCPRLGEGCFYEGTDGYCCHSLFDPKKDNHSRCSRFCDVGYRGKKKSEN